MDHARHQQQSVHNEAQVKDKTHSNNNIPPQKFKEGEQRIEPTKWRYVILALYAICSMEKSFQWINLSTITNKVALYYDVDNIAVNWTSVLFMLLFVPLILPTSWLIERIGLRKAVLIGSLGITVGAIIKCFSVEHDRFYVVILGQIVVSISEQFIYCIPSKVAAVWFEDEKISLATAVGIFGNQAGIALGFIVPQALLSGLETRDNIGSGLWQLYLWTAVVATVTLVVLLFLFDDAPKHAPGKARLHKMSQEEAKKGQVLGFGEEMRQFGALLLRLTSKKNNALLIVAYGISVGTGYAVQTLLNQIISSADWPNANRLVGIVGLVVIFFGMLGALFWGHLCDLTHKYVLINKILYAGALASTCAFGLTLRLYNESFLYLASALLGFNLIGCIVVGLDTAVELTFPEPELITTSVMNLSPQIFGTAITFVGSTLADTYRGEIATMFLGACLAVGLLVMLMIREHLNRQATVNRRLDEFVIQSEELA